MTAARSMRPDRDAILDAVADVLVRRGRAVDEMQTVVEESGLAYSDVEREFDDGDEIILALVDRVTREVAGHLNGAPEGDEEARAKLLAFASALHEANGTILIALHRVILTEGTRRPDLRQRFLDVGSGAVSGALTRFLKSAKGRDILDVDDCELAGEHLMGMLREPLYLALALHQDGSTSNSAAAMTPQAAIDAFWNGYGSKGGERDGRG